jgi:hypothetical protein
MEDKLELIYYRMLELEARLDEKVQYIKNAQELIQAVVIELKEIKKEIKEK